MTMYALQPRLSTSQRPFQAERRARTVRPSAVVGVASAKPGAISAARGTRRVHLQRLGVVGGDLAAVRGLLMEDVGDPLGTVARVPVARDEPGVARVDGGVVRGDDEARRRVGERRQRVVRDPADPFVGAIPAGNRPHPAVVRVGADGHVARQLVADMPVDVGIGEVLRRRTVQRERRPELVEGAGLVQPEDRVDRVFGGDGGRPAEGVERRVVPEARIGVVDGCGPWPVEPDREASRRAAAGDLDRLHAGRERDRLPLEEEVVRGSPGRPVPGRGPPRPVRRSWRPTRSARCAPAPPPAGPGRRPRRRRTGTQRSRAGSGARS